MCKEAPQCSTMSLSQAQKCSHVMTDWEKNTPNLEQVRNSQISMCKHDRLISLHCFFMLINPQSFQVKTSGTSDRFVQQRKKRTKYMTELTYSDNSTKQSTD